MTSATLRTWRSGPSSGASRVLEAQGSVRVDGALAADGRLIFYSSHELDTVHASSMVNRQRIEARHEDDQVANDLRMWSRGAVCDGITATRELIRQAAERAVQSPDEWVGPVHEATLSAPSTAAIAVANAFATERSSVTSHSIACARAASCRMRSGPRRW